MPVNADVAIRIDITFNSGALNSGPKNELTLEEWNTIECVYAGTFIPTGNTLNNVTDYAAQYWTSDVDPNNSNQALTWNISTHSNAGGGTSSYTKNQQKPVRLAQNYIPLTITTTSK